MEEKLNQQVDVSTFCTAYFNEVDVALKALDWEAIQNVSRLLYATKEREDQIFFFGNGGSLSIATHMACDLGKGTKVTGATDQKYYKAHSLDNAAWLSAQANDGKEPFTDGDYSGNFTHGYDGIFVGQMENFLRKGDVAFGISSSGNSANVVNALQYARERGATTVAMVGFDGGAAARAADHVILVKTEKGKYGVVEAVHCVIHHYLYEQARLLEGL